MQSERTRFAVDDESRLQMTIQLARWELRHVEVQTRMPFRYGIATLTRVPYLLVYADFLIDGMLVEGVAADVLPPKWFTKRPEMPLESEIREMLRVIRSAAAHTDSLSAQPTVYRWWRELYELQQSDMSLVDASGEALMRSPAPMVTVLAAPRAARCVIIVQAKFLPRAPVRLPSSMRPWKSLTVSRLTGVEPAGIGPLPTLVPALAEEAKAPVTSAAPATSAPTLVCCRMKKSSVSGSFPAAQVETPSELCPRAGGPGTGAS